MYTVIKNLQIVISLLKEYHIKHLVLSPGSRNVPFVHSVENDSYFQCYSVVDERSAAFFALGLSEELNEPVLISCTSSTAASNYLPAIKEAHNRGIQLIALTADRDPRYREQMENQMIMQPSMYGNYCKKSVDLPTVNSEMDWLYCERLVNETLLELNHHGKGPVHINYPAFGNFFDYSITNLKKCRKITRIESNSSDTIWRNKLNELKQCNRIMLLFGEGNKYSNKYIEMLNKVFDCYNCIISIEHMSNINCKGSLRTFIVTESISDDEINEILPEIIITFGANFASDFKYKLRKNYNKIKHWRVSQQGNVVDTFMALDTIFECSDVIFFNKILENADNGMNNNLKYYNLWENKIKNIKFPDLGFTNFNAINVLTQRLPSNSILHLSILNSIRLTQFFDIDKSVKVFANLGAYGIDGSLSTFLGQAKDNNNLAFLVIGDLSFFYDMSSTLIPYVGSNIRILLINNHSGGEFHYVYHNTGIEQLKCHISAGHNSNARDWVENFPFRYFCARNQKELEEAMKNFIDFKSKKPIMLEVFTNAEIDASTLCTFYKINRHYNCTTILKKITKKIIEVGSKCIKNISYRN